MWESSVDCARQWSPSRSPCGIDMRACSSDFTMACFKCILHENVGCRCWTILLSLMSLDIARNVQKSVSSASDLIATTEDHRVGTNANISTEDGQLNQPEYNASVRSSAKNPFSQLCVCLVYTITRDMF